ncbi:hypothetical protein FA13DRAFT_164848 [Coprinellus micaceus]|uniref:Uncharacterized protein n=1 Tax=Coprinellus micaceus TaxID=71717 RepID=A0A4Y7SGW0_COPMI|nr:hypothetical protein FA13DRAFT_164848 [Coprinellus micaceus]
MVERFSGDLMNAVSRCFLAIDKPDGVRQALLDIILSGTDQESIANTVGEGLTSGLASKEKSIEEKIVIMGFVITVMHGMGVVQGMAPAEMRTFIHLFMVTLSLGHSALRGAKVQEAKLAQTSAKRFKDLFDGYKVRPGQDTLEGELQKLLHTPNNLCLVLWQGALAYLAYNNACRVRKFMIGAPDEWLQFVLARDSDLCIGSQ